jgi:hypothetical protein
MELTVRLPAGPHRRFAPTAWDAAVGESMPVRLPDGGTAPGRLTAAVVVEDGAAAELTFTVDIEEAPGVAQWLLDGLSLGEGGDDARG